MPSFLVTGSEGQLGRCFQAVAKEFPEHQLIFTKKNILDLTLPNTFEQVYQIQPFDGIINCAAYTQVDRAEEESLLTQSVNVDGIKNIIDFAEKKALSIIHFSTDYVFDGITTNPYIEDFPPQPINAYGHSKYLGEEILKKASCPHIIIRLSWLFSPFGRNFVKTILKLSFAKGTIKVVNDQHGRPTYGIDLAKTVLKLISNDTIDTLPILHYANKGICNWKEFAEAIVNESGNKTQVIGVSTSDYPTLAKRPKYSILDTERIEKKLGITIPTWQESLKKCVQILKSDGSL